MKKNKKNEKLLEDGLNKMKKSILDSIEVFKRLAKK